MSWLSSNWFRWVDETGIVRIRRHNPDHAVGGKHYRKMPVANIRCMRGGFGIFRYPRTQQELREIDKYYHDEDMKTYKVKHRASRNRTPTAWDDQFRSDQRIKNWKKYRKHQWKQEIIMATFKEAFAAAKKAGKETFIHEGKVYTTEIGRAHV